jgi:quercetin dioxygenase-like cupin family protein
MDLSRRNLALLFTSTALGRLNAQQAPVPPLPSKAYHGSQIRYLDDPENAAKKGREFFIGHTHGGFNLQAHETILGPGAETHAPHKHVHEEIVILVEGTLEWYLEGRTERVESGSVLYFGSNQMHSVRNAGASPCRYYVVELRGDEA